VVALILWITQRLLVQTRTCPASAAVNRSDPQTQSPAFRIPSCTGFIPVHQSCSKILSCCHPQTTVSPQTGISFGTQQPAFTRQPGGSGHPEGSPPQPPKAYEHRCCAIRYRITIVANPQSPGETTNPSFHKSRRIKNLRVKSPEKFPDGDPTFMQVDKGGVTSAGSTGWRTRSSGHPLGRATVRQPINFPCSQPQQQRAL